jgi:hypothetical protein
LFPFSHRRYLKIVKLCKTSSNTYSGLWGPQVHFIPLHYLKKYRKGRRRTISCRRDLPQDLPALSGPSKPAVQS